MADVGAYKDKRGRQLDLARSIPTTLTGAPSNGTTDVVLIDNPGAGRRIRLFKLIITTADDAAQLITFETAAADGTGDATLAVVNIQAANVAQAPFVLDFQGAALAENRQLEFSIPEAGILTVYVTAEYVIEDVGAN